MAILTLALPYSPVAEPLGLVPIPPALLLALIGLTAGYVLATELVKRWFYGARGAAEASPA